MAPALPIAQRGDIVCSILPEMANRHGLITGATGTGKTVTLQKIAESFSAAGVPVFLA
ncbi:MAG: helicase HerA-like domain-containing protein, partial [Comamonas sp.]